MAKKKEKLNPYDFQIEIEQLRKSIARGVDYTRKNKRGYQEVWDEFTDDSGNEYQTSLLIEKKNKHSINLADNAEIIDGID